MAKTWGRWSLRGLFALVALCSIGCRKWVQKMCQEPKQSGAPGQKVNHSERGLRNTMSGRLCASVRGGKITAQECESLHAEAVRLFRAKPVEFTGSSSQQTAQHLRHLQRTIIALIARSELAQAGGGAAALRERIVADVDRELGEPPAYNDFDVDAIAKAAQSKVVATVLEATRQAQLEGRGAYDVARIGDDAARHEPPATY